MSVADFTTTPEVTSNSSMNTTLRRRQPLTKSANFITISSRPTTRSTQHEQRVRLGNAHSVTFLTSSLSQFSKAAKERRGVHIYIHSASTCAPSSPDQDVFALSHKWTHSLGATSSNHQSEPLWPQSIVEVVVSNLKPPLPIFLSDQMTASPPKRATDINLFRKVSANTKGGFLPVGPLAGKMSHFPPQRVAQLPSVS